VPSSMQYVLVDEKYDNDMFYSHNLRLKCLENFPFEKNFIQNILTKIYLNTNVRKCA
jgi:hypothetical protein